MTHLPRKLRATTLATASFILGGLGADASYALSCIAGVPVEKGFMYERQTLPANAKGVVFRADMGLDFYTPRNGSPGARVLTHSIRKPLSASDFEVRNSLTGQKLEAAVKPILIGRQIGMPPREYIGIDNPKLRSCAQENRFSLDGCTELDESLPKMMQQGKARKVTEAVEGAYGAFLISPKEGFQSETAYDIHYVGPIKDEALVRYRRGIYIWIDGRPLPPLGDGDVQVKLWKKQFRYALPESYGAYLDNVEIHSFVRRESTGDNIPLADESLMGTPGRCGGYSTQGKDLKFGEYLPQRSPYCYEVHGYVGFLELDGRLQKSDSVRAECTRQ